MKRYKVILSPTSGGDGFNPKVEEKQEAVIPWVRPLKYGQRIHVKGRTWTVLRVEEVK